MKPKHIVLAALIGWSALGVVGCSKVNDGIPPAPTAGKFLKGADGPPLVFVDNVELGNLQPRSFKVEPDNIKSMTVLSPAYTPNLVSRYGPKGKNGVVLVTTRKAAK